MASPTRVVAKVSPKPKTLLRLKMAISICCLIPCLRSDGSVAKRMPTSAKASRKRSRKARRLRNLRRMENFQQRRVHKQSFRLAYEFGEDLAPQSFQKASELAHPPVEGGRVESSHPRKQVREEPLDIPQERAFALAFALHAPKLLEDSEGDDFGVRKALYGLVAVSTRVEMGVSLVHETEEDSQSL